MPKIGQLFYFRGRRKTAAKIPTKWWAREDSNPQSLL